MSEVKLIEMYGSAIARALGKRSWGIYKEPLQFNIAVNEMADVVKHKDIPLARTNSHGIQSTLGGCGIAST